MPCPYINSACFRLCGCESHPSLFRIQGRPAGRPYVLFAFFAAKFLLYFFSSLGKP